jgi:hypothetical protein
LERNYITPSTKQNITRIILNRIKQAVEIMVRKEEADFRMNRSCVDHINTLRIIIQQSMEWNSPLYMIFVDLEKAFDKVNRDEMQKILLKFCIPQKIVNLVQETYRDYSCQVVHNGQKSNPIKTYTGVRQGCTLSPTIFIIVMDIIMRNTVGKAKRGLQWNMYDRLEDL